MLQIYSTPATHNISCAVLHSQITSNQLKMFRHQGESRTPRHNVRIAVPLSFIAGLVNITGFLGIHTLTSNVTGHFATLILGTHAMDWTIVFIYIGYLASFLVGSFTSGVLIEWIRIHRKINKYLLPTLLEFTILVIVPFMVYSNVAISPSWIACLLLFAMGVQNSFVTRISDAVVRTTHLTGLFTDLGLELSHLLFSSQKQFYRENVSTIKLRLNIIFFFFLGGLVGVILYNKIGFFVLLFAAGILLIGLFLDDVQYNVKKLFRWVNNKSA
ncbi:Uncharacterized membrane protein YoaK, UPF0700 family [Saccharicrinis carchari]|uniref:Uncharacterized membrane protein YoaK, UPF0700 family n=1 Tax=Saccharicrinis carchari TaxID=1168039 RepID=A0A521B5Q1_SACCC|nr:YoaK family protein [Saccharicrinis carchari]SMO42385.1 Uncharacterized membrane protein YoaK, UPF0700 family [Saccharicrinis carchari]